MGSSFGKLDTKDFEQFVSEFENKANGDVIVREIEQVMVKTAGIAVNKVKSKTPVDSGALRRGWQASGTKRSGNDLSIEIFNNVAHAPFIENGHRIVRGGKTVGFQGGTFMLKDTIDLIDAQWGRTLGAKLEKTLIEALGGK